MKRKYFVSGLHCPSCEVLIEKKLTKKPSIKSADVSLVDQTLTVQYSGKGLDASELNDLFRDEGYTFSDVTATSYPKSRNYTISLTKGGIKDALWIVGSVIVVVISLILLGRSGLSSLITVNSSSSLPVFFLFGLLAGASSCAALVGGLLLSMSKQWSDIYGSSTSRKYIPHISFNIGRVLSFLLLGAVLGGIGRILTLSPTLYAFITISIAVLMLVLGLQMLGVKALSKIRIALPKSITKRVVDERNFQGRYMPFVLGALTFFLPCGFTIAAQGLALASGSALHGGLIMLVFALGTLPMLLLIGVSSSTILQKPHLSSRFLKVAGILVIIFAFSNINAQLNVLGVSSLDDLAVSNSSGRVDDLAPIIDGTQVIQMKAGANAYTPNYFKVMVDIPVRWEIENVGVSGCTNAIISKGLFDGQISIDKEKVYKEFVVENPGIYKFSCWMGMVTGTIEVISSDTTENGDPGSRAVISAQDEDGAGGCSGSCGGSCGGACGGGEPSGTEDKTVDGSTAGCGCGGH